MCLGSEGGRRVAGQAGLNIRLLTNSAVPIDQIVIWSLRLVYIFYNDNLLNCLFLFLYLTVIALEIDYAHPVEYRVHDVKPVQLRLHLHRSNGFIFEWRKRGQMTPNDGFNLPILAFTPHERTVCNAEQPWPPTRRTLPHHAPVNFFKEIISPGEIAPNRS